MIRVLTSAREARPLSEQLGSKDRVGCVIGPANARRVKPLFPQDTGSSALLATEFTPRLNNRSLHRRLPPSNFFFSSVMFMPRPLSSLHSTSNATGMPASSLFVPLTMLS